MEIRFRIPTQKQEAKQAYDAAFKNDLSVISMPNGSFYTFVRTENWGLLEDQVSSAVGREYSADSYRQKAQLLQHQWCEYASHISKAGAVLLDTTDKIHKVMVTMYGTPCTLNGGIKRLFTGVDQFLNISDKFQVHVLDGLAYGAFFSAIAADKCSRHLRKDELSCLASLYAGQNGNSPYYNVSPDSMQHVCDAYVQNSQNGFADVVKAVVTKRRSVD